MSGVPAVQNRPALSDSAQQTQGYIVKPGDSLWAIAKAHGISLEALEKANPQFTNPDLIRPGQFVNLPEGASASASEDVPETYTVERGDTLSEIGERFGIDWHVLAQVNQLSNPDLILTGQTLKIGGAATDGAPSSPSADVQNMSAQPTEASGPVRDIGAPSGSMKGRIDQAMQFFQSQGWSRAQAAGIVANLQAESGVDASRAQNGGGPGFGLAQWEGPRQADFARWAGHDIHNSTFEEQLKFIQYELTHSESGAGRALRGATDAADAARIVCRLYERPADIVGDSEHRARLARQI